MKDLGHRMILASAGSGKTYTLVNRFLRLLTLDVEPGRIIALTFTRKAAGEFLQKIFLRLMEAARSESAASRLSRELQVEERRPAFYREILGRLVREIGSLQLGTIDSFFARIVGAFPYELGLTRPHRMMDDFEQNMARQLAMERLMAYGDEERASQILQLYKDFTWGAEEKSVYRIFEDSLKTYHGLFLEVRNTSVWGKGDRIFTSPPWWAGQDRERQALIEEIREDLLGESWSPAIMEKFNTLLALFENWQPGQPVKAGVLFERLLENRDALAAGFAEITVSRKTLEIGSPLAGHLLELLKTFVRLEIARRLVMTESLGSLLSTFDRFYAASVRETGSLVFADLPMLLINGLSGKEAALGAEDIIYRLDGQTDHWLVDEFQDTSRIQWKVLSAFVDEVLQDPEGRRTFFYVGDVKQSIYGWRGGDSRLFDEIFRKYGERDGGIRKSVLNVSWRSAPPVLECVNRLFGDNVSPGLVGDEVAGRWKEGWSHHQSSPATEALAGHAAWGVVPAESSVPEGCIHIINTVNPLRNGLSCAILVRRNKEVLEITQALREAGIAASMEGVVHIAMDNIVGAWMRACFLAVARPDEAFPAAFTGVAGFSFDKEEQRAFAGRIRQAITEDGYAEAVRLVISRMGKKMALTPFLKRRSEQLLEAATRFEGTGNESLEAFIHYLQMTTVEESSLTSQIQVMTVHKAKGLDFDMVIVAGFGPDPLVQTKNRGLHVERREDGEVNWILDMPNKVVWEQDPCLREASEREESQNVFEALCLLYVAMTRARQGLYCLAEDRSGNSSKTTWHRFFESAFGNKSAVGPEGIHWHAEFGNRDWYKERPASGSTGTEPVRLQRLETLPRSHRPSLGRAASPSTESHHSLTFEPVLRSTEGRRFGTLVHDFLATLEWIDLDRPDEVSMILERAPAEIRDRLRQFFSTEPAKAVFSRPASACLAWREKPYILRKGSQVANGIIDRATVYLDESGRPQRVRIFDFKTDALDPDRSVQEQLMERYAVQVDRYCEAVAVLTGLPREAISANLVPV